MSARLAPDLAERVPELHRSLLDAASGPVAALDIEQHVRAHLPLCGPDEVAALTQRLDELLHGLGPLDALLADPAITEVMVNGPGPVWVERAGRLEPTQTALDAAAIRLAIDRVTGPLGLRLDRVVPFVDARLADGSRVHITVPPMAVDGPYLTIRRFPDKVHALASFAEPPVAELLASAVRDRANILVTGATGAGKTSLLNTLGGHIDCGERVVTIEDSAELRLPGPHVVRLEARAPNGEGVGEITMRTLVRNALRMRPDRLVVGEVRGAEAFEMLHALSTGHSGSLSTCHANTPVDALDRLTSMVMMSDAPLTAELARRMIEASLDLVVHVERSAGGNRRVGAVVRVTHGTAEALVQHGAVVSAGSP